MTVDLRNNGNGMTDAEFIRHIHRLKIPNFRGYIMRDQLNELKPLNNECGALNIDDSSNNGTHTVCWFKKGKKKYYFDSFGVLPPKELISYLKSPIMYSTYQIQKFDETNCSEWCLYVLNEFYKGVEYPDIILNILDKYKWMK